MGHACYFFNSFKLYPSRLSLPHSPLYSLSINVLRGGGGDTNAMTRLVAQCRDREQRTLSAQQLALARPEPTPLLPSFSISRWYRHPYPCILTAPMGGRSGFMSSQQVRCQTHLGARTLTTISASRQKASRVEVLVRGLEGDFMSSKGHS